MMLAISVTTTAMPLAVGFGCLGGGRMSYPLV
jgi:hypothetical protein